MDVEISTSTKEQEAEKRKRDHDDSASELQYEAHPGKITNAFTNLAPLEFTDHMVNLTSVTSSPQSFSVNRKLEDVNMRKEAMMQPGLDKVDSGVEQSDDSTVCLTFIKQVGKSEKTIPDKLSASSELSEHVWPHSETSSEIIETTDESFGNTGKEREGSRASQDNDFSCKQESRPVEEQERIRMKEIETIGMEGSIIQEATAESSSETKSGNLFVSHPNILIQMIEFQVCFIMTMFSVGLEITKFTLAAVFKPIETIVHAKTKITEALNVWVSMIMEVNEFILEEMGRLVPLLRKAARKWFYCVLVGTYITILLVCLLVPALLLDFLLINRLVEQPIEVQETLHFNYSLPHPSAVVSLFQSQKMSMKYHFSEGNADGFPQVIIATASHKIDVTVFLKMPESDHNLQLGMFQISAELLSVTGHSLEKFNQPCMLQYYSNPVRYLRSILMAVPTVLGLYAETQTQIIRLVTNAAGDIKNPIGSIKICLEPRAGLSVAGGLPEIYAAKALVQSKLSGLKFIVYKCKVLIFVWIALFLFGMEVAFLACCCSQIFVPKLLYISESTDRIAAEHHLVN